MLNHLRMKNFKAWQDTGNVRMAPLALFFGTNSAGKTSIAQLLLMLKQTAASSDRARPLHFGDENTLVDLGDFSGVIHTHEVDRSLAFELGWRLRHRLKFSDAYHGEKYEAERLRFRAEIASSRQAQPYVQELHYELELSPDGSIALGMKRHQDGSNADKYQLTRENYSPIARAGRTWPLPAPSHFHGFPDEAVAYYQNTGFLADLNLEMSRLLESIHYVGPLRKKPQRLYRWSGETPMHVGERGERAIEAILAAGHYRRYNFKPKQNKRTLDVIVAQRLKRMGLIHDFRVEPVAEGRKEYEVRVVVHDGAPGVLLTDVGFGVSQVLPVIVESFYVPSGSIVIFEQPEIHLHAAVQAELADLFIDAIHAREGGRLRDVQFIVESHSEHFLRRLQRRIAEEAITPEETALYFVHHAGTQARLEELQLDEYGRIANWPDGFFGDALGETEAQMTSTMERMMREPL